ncbi:uncharacterized protein LOC130800408 [Amaranthus tricolor]|uniref:uncharacterized protein LOC130800408 n=1 Tax=Amaranthus tricolor TaxID=29722 RepID=UPI0025845AAC|nr:uncharacterized protein LOC130800408 [Amaranthus tricolor]
MTVDSDSPSRDTWVIVKKQRVNILIPRLSCTEQSIVPDLEGQVDKDMSIHTINTHEVLQETTSKAHFSENINNVSTHCSPKSYTRSSPDACPSRADDTTPEPRKSTSKRMAAEDLAGTSKPLLRKTKFLKFHKESQNLLRPSYHNLSSSTVTLNLTYKMRALNLEKTIVSAGGLGKWLFSLGLGRFEGIFRTKNVNKFELVNMSMKKLKEMGAHAVGPRRKLIHAIECACCKPYCFEPHMIFSIKHSES